MLPEINSNDFGVFLDLISRFDFEFRPQESWSSTTLSGKTNARRNRIHVVLDLFSNLNFVRSSGYLVNLWSTSTLCGQILVSCRVLCVLVCCVCWHTRKRFKRTHGHVLNRHTEVLNGHTTPPQHHDSAHTPLHTRTQDTTQHNDTTTTPHGDRERQADRDREKKRLGQKREDEERLEKRRQKKTKQDDTGKAETSHEHKRRWNRRDKTRQECKEKREGVIQDKRQERIEKMKEKKQRYDEEEKRRWKRKQETRRRRKKMKE